MTPDKLIKRYRVFGFALPFEKTIDHGGRCELDPGRKFGRPVTRIEGANGESITVDRLPSGDRRKLERSINALAVNAGQLAEAASS